MVKSLRQGAQRPKFAEPLFCSKPKTFHYLHNHSPPPQKYTNSFFSPAVRKGRSLNMGKGERWRREKEGRNEMSYVKIHYGKKALSPAASAEVCQPHATGRRERMIALRLDPLVPEEEELVGGQHADPTSARGFISGKSHPEQQCNTTTTSSREERGCPCPMRPKERSGFPASQRDRTQVKIEGNVLKTLPKKVTCQRVLFEKSERPPHLATEETPHVLSDSSMRPHLLLPALRALLP